MVRKFTGGASAAKARLTTPTRCSGSSNLRTPHASASAQRRRSGRPLCAKSGRSATACRLRPSVEDPKVRVLMANDAAGEGVNLQRGAHLMVNYGLPWNPNRLEQRFGPIHRIGQTEVCHLWNLVAANTREGEVYA
jgi:Helicase conserved C-terminal domain